VKIPDTEAFTDNDYYDEVILENSVMLEDKQAKTQRGCVG